MVVSRMRKETTTVMEDPTLDGPSAAKDNNYVEDKHSNNDDDYDSFSDEEAESGIET